MDKKTLKAVLAAMLSLAIVLGSLTPAVFAADDSENEASATAEAVTQEAGSEEQKTEPAAAEQKTESAAAQKTEPTAAQKTEPAAPDAKAEDEAKPAEVKTEEAKKVEPQAAETGASDEEAAEAVTYTVMFDGASAPAQKVRKGETAKAPEVPAREGKTSEWLLDGRKWDFGKDKVTKDMRLTLAWADEIYEIDFDSDGGSSVGSQKVKYGSRAVQPEDPKKDNFAFAGWYTRRDGKEEKYDFSRPVKGKQTIHGKWNPILAEDYIVEFDTDGGTPNPKQFVKMGMAPAKPVDPKKDGYDFAGWFLNEGGKEYPYSFDKPLNRNTKLYSKWTPAVTRNLTIRFVNYSRHEYSYVAKYGSTVTRPHKDPVSSARDLVFDDWYIDEALTTRANFPIVAKTDMTFYAKWVNSAHAVSFFVNNHPYAKERVLHGMAVKAPAAPDSWNRDLVFDGWYLSKDGSGAAYDFRSPVRGDLNLYAKFVKKLHTVTFEVGRFVQPVQTLYHVPHLSKIRAPKDPVKPSFVFAGWYDNQNFAGAAWDFSKDVVRDDMTLYAKWADARHKVVFDANGGFPAPRPEIVGHGEKIRPVADPAKKGLIFIGWFDNKELEGYPWDFAANTVLSDLTLFAKFVPNVPTALFKVPLVTKKVAGDNAPQELFAFELSAFGKGGPLPIGAKAGALVKTVKGEGTAYFGEIAFTKAGEYTYQVKEISGSNPAFDYDKAVYTLKVIVGERHGKPYIENSFIYANGKKANLSTFAFSNKYYDKSVSFEVSGSKTILGDEPGEDETFRFALVPAKKGQPMPAGSSKGIKEASVDGSGAFTFGKIVFTEPGMYVYKAAEYNDHAAGYEYDTSVYQLTIVVKQNKHGFLYIAEKKISLNKGWKGEKAIVFTNTFTDEEETVDPTPTSPSKPKPQPQLPDDLGDSEDVSPSTGDSSSLGLMMAIMGASLAVGLFAVLKFRKKKAVQ